MHRISIPQAHHGHSRCSTLALHRDESMDKKESMREIAELMAMQESAIDNHPPKLVSTYRSMRDTIIAGQHTSWESKSGSIVSLTDFEVSRISHYITCSSFISAWYHLAGEKPNRDKAAHSCTVLVSSLGPDDTEVLRKYIETERLWRSVMKRAGVAPKRIGTITFLVFALIIVVIAVFVFGK